MYYIYAQYSNKVLLRAKIVLFKSYMWYNHNGMPHIKVIFKVPETSIFSLSLASEYSCCGSLEILRALNEHFTYSEWSRTDRTQFSATSSPHMCFRLHYLLAVGDTTFLRFSWRIPIPYVGLCELTQRNVWVIFVAVLGVLTWWSSCKSVILSLVFLPEKKEILNVNFDCKLTNVVDWKWAISDF
jgi:hypothetical protein